MLHPIFLGSLATSLSCPLSYTLTDLTSAAGTARPKHEYCGKRQGNLRQCDLQCNDQVLWRKFPQGMRAEQTPSLMFTDLSEVQTGRHPRHFSIAKMHRPSLQFQAVL